MTVPARVARKNEAPAPSWGLICVWLGTVVTMLQNSPIFRFVLYALAVLMQVIAFFVRVVDDAWGQAVQDAANFLGALAGITAIGNLSSTKPPA